MVSDQFVMSRIVKAQPATERNKFIRIRVYPFPYLFQNGTFWFPYNNQVLLLTRTPRVDNATQKELPRKKPKKKPKNTAMTVTRRKPNLWIMRTTTNDSRNSSSFVHSSPSIWQQISRKILGFCKEAVLQANVPIWSRTSCLEFWILVIFLSDTYRKSLWARIRESDQRQLLGLCNQGTGRETCKSRPWVGSHGCSEDVVRRWLYWCSHW